MVVMTSAVVAAAVLMLVAPMKAVLMVVIALLMMNAMITLMIGLQNISNLLKMSEDLKASYFRPLNFRETFNLQDQTCERTLRIKSAISCRFQCVHKS